MNLETTEKIFDPTEQIKESTVACVDVFCRLKILTSKWTTKSYKRCPTKKRTPMPEKMIFAGENTLEAVVRALDLYKNRIAIITRLTPSPRVAENA